MADEVKVKRPAKAQTINYIESQFSCFQAGIFDAKTVGLTLQKGGYFLYKSEVEKIIEEKKDDKNFNAQAFVKMLVDANALKEGSAPSFGGADVVKIDSRERALEVANEPGNTTEVEQIMQIMSAMKALAKKAEPLINKKATISIALKNKTSKEDKEKAAESVAQA